MTKPVDTFKRLNMLTEEAPRELERLGDFLTALGDPTRQAILVTLSRERLNVGELTERFSLSRPAVSHHLRILADAGLLRRERQGRERLYTVDAARCRAFAAELKGFIDDCCSGAACCSPNQTELRR